MRLQRGGYLRWYAPATLVVENDTGQIMVEAWISPIFGEKAEITAEHPMRFVAKAAARRQINTLLVALGQEPLS